MTRYSSLIGHDIAQQLDEPHSYEQHSDEPHSAGQQALQKACAAVGGQKPLAARIGTTQSMVWYWLARSKRGVPGEFVLPIEAATGGRVNRHELRPDLYPRGEIRTSDVQSIPAEAREARDRLCVSPAGAGAAA